MKKTVSAIALLLLVASLASCGSEDPTITYLETKKKEAVTEPAHNTASETQASVLTRTLVPIVLGISDVTELHEPSYSEGGVVYVDLEDFADYFGADCEISADKKIATVNRSSKIYAFEIGKTEVSVSDLKSSDTTVNTLSVAPRVNANNRVEISAVDFATLMGYTCEMKNGALMIHAKK